VSPSCGFARLLTFPNVIITAHQGVFTRQALTAIAETTLDNLASLERGERCPNEVPPPPACDIDRAAFAVPLPTGHAGPSFGPRGEV
jgi:phosphoglycerate dehydrogenase-like enzyme